MRQWFRSLKSYAFIILVFVFLLYGAEITIDLGLKGNPTPITFHRVEGITALLLWMGLIYIVLPPQLARWINMEIAAAVPQKWKDWVKSKRSKNGEEEPNGQ